MNPQLIERLEIRAAQSGSSVEELLNRLLDAPSPDALSAATESLESASIMNMRHQYEDLQARMAAIVESSFDAIISKSLTGIIASWNASAERLFDYQESEVVGKPITILFPPDRIGEEAEILARISRGERIEHYETIRLHKDGHPIPVSVTISPVRDNTGEIVGISKIVRDISERKQLDQQRHDFGNMLERERVRFLASFVEGASHEYRTPLAIINTSTYIIARSNDLEQRQQKAKIIADQVFRITHLIEMLLKRVTLEANLDEHLPVDVSQMLEDLRSYLAKAPESVPIQWQIDANLPRVMGSVKQLFDAVEQILDNARQAITLTGQVIVKAYTRESCVVVEVTDDGIGISAESMPHIFESFWRLDEAHATAGFGLGLAIAQKTVELHGGQIEVESEFGKGSVFRVILPAIFAYEDSV